MESVYNQNCSQYEGICSIHLNKLTTPNNKITTMINNDITEQQLSQIFSILKDFSTLINKKCASIVMPFLCQYAYPPCDGNGSVQFITQEQCINIRDEVCASEWKFVMATNLGSLLPICEIFGNNNSLITKEKVSVSPKCHYQFKEFCGVCLPLCSAFSQYPDQIRLSEKIVILTASILAIIGGIIVFIVAVIRQKTL